MTTLKERDDEALFDDKEECEQHGQKVVTMSDVAECLQKDFSEEIADAKKYLHMARIAEAAGNEHDNHYLLEMAKDECTHAIYIHDFMKRHAMCISEADEKCFAELKAEMQEFF